MITVSKLTVLDDGVPLHGGTAFLEGWDVSACPPGTVEEMKLWCKQWITAKRQLRETQRRPWEKPL
jgi:hypothetical protein